MYHIRNSGTHYKAGFTYGSRLKKFGIFLLDVVPFEIDEERIAFSSACEKHYQEHYPEILQEIKGLADGQEADYQKFLAVLLSMYCVIPDQKCTNICFKGQDGVLLGRNSDFLVSIENYTMNCLYKLENSYSFSANTTAFIEMEDGMNEHGFAIGLTSVYPTVMQPGLNAGMLIRYLLEKCRNVDEALACLRKLPVASSHTLAMADTTGNYVLVEANCKEMEILYPKNQSFLVSTNAFHSDTMRSYTMPLGSIDDWRQEERYQDTRSALATCDKPHDLTFMKELLSGKHGFICQYDRKETGTDTVWSVIYDVTNKQIYRVEGNPGRKKFKLDNRFTFSTSK